MFLLSKIKNPQGQIRNGYKIIGFIALLLVLLAVFQYAPISGSTREWLLVAAALAASWFCLKHEGEPLSSIGLCINARFFMEFIIGALLGIVLILLIAMIIKGFGGFTWVHNPQASLGGLFYALVPFLAVSMFEELLFRGYIFQRAVRGLGKTYALALFALLFAIAHWGNPGMEGSAKLLGSLNIGLASLLLGLAWIKTGSLAMPIGIHLGWNWAQGSLLGFGVSGVKVQGYWGPVFNDMPPWFTGGSFGLEASLPGVVVCTIACVGFAMWKQKTDFKEKH
jgi:membrane protease YdiL (CAAX protease family)